MGAAVSVGVRELYCRLGIAGRSFARSAANLKEAAPISIPQEMALESLHQSNLWDKYWAHDLCNLNERPLRISGHTPLILLRGARVSWGRVLPVRSRKTEERSCSVAPRFGCFLSC
jgi:hypothetical protein